MRLDKINAFGGTFILICGVLLYLSPDNPDDGNIQLKSADGIEFTIYTDRDALSPTKTIENLKLVFNQD